MTPPLITYKLTDIFRFRTIAELPLKAVSFSKVVNGVGPWSATLNVEDRKVRRSNWIEATNIYRSAMWIDVDGVLLYGGIVTGRNFQSSTGQVSLSGSDFCLYLSQRLQARDYTNFRGWAEGKGAPVLDIAYTILAEAMRERHSIPLKIVAAGATAREGRWITFSAPIEQEQTLSSILAQLAELGYTVGVDYACDVEYIDGLPAAIITLSYPRRGAELAPPVIDLANTLDFDYDEDATALGNFMVAQAGAWVVRSSDGEWPPALAQGYPLTETVLSLPSAAPTGEGEGAALEAYVSGALMAGAYPITQPLIKLPMFGTPSIMDLAAGDDCRLRIPQGRGALPSNNPRFPQGLDYLFRATQIDGEIPDEGVPVMTLTLNLPPSLTPVLPPEFVGIEGPPEEGREKEEERTEEEINPIREEAEKIAEAAEKLAEETGNTEAKEKAHHAKENAEEAKTMKDAEEALALAEEAHKHAASKTEEEAEIKEAEEAGYTFIGSGVLVVAIEGEATGGATVEVHPGGTEDKVGPKEKFDWAGPYGAGPYKLVVIQGARKQGTISVEGGPSSITATWATGGVEGESFGFLLYG